MALSQDGSCAGQGITAGTQLRGPYRFTYVKSGGFAGIHHDLLVDSASRQLTLRRRNEPPTTVEASQEDLQELAEKLEAADFLHIERSFQCEGCADQFAYSGTLSTGGVTHSVRWEDSSGAPPELFAISELADRLIEESFASSPSREPSPSTEPRR